MSILINLITASCIIFYLIAVLNLLVNLKENDSVIENKAPFWSLIGAIMHFIVISLDIYFKIRESIIVFLAYSR